jgi:ribosomal protein L35AE/L33A
LTITPDAGDQIIDVHCNAKAGRKVLRGRLQRFYTSGVSGPATVACRWQLPANTSGKLLQVTAYVLTTKVTSGFMRRGTFSWHIKP